jgi:hypothetical protein
MTKLFRIMWEIDMEANSPLEAVKKAIEVFPHERNEDTLATIFDVKELGDASDVLNRVQIDTLETNPFDDEDLKDALYDQNQIDEEREVDYQKTMEKIRNENF